MAFTLGSAPDQLKVILVTGADFVSSLTTRDNTDWPAGAQVSLEFTTPTPTIWNATVAGPTISWNVDQADVVTLITERPRGVKLWYVEGPLRLLWAQGSVDMRR